MNGLIVGLASWVLLSAPLAIVVGRIIRGAARAPRARALPLKPARHAPIHAT
jgi:hypothetical protein